MLGIRPDRSILRIWDVFQALTNVKTLDIAYLSHDHTHPLASQFSDIRFPAATTIRLSGVMHYSFAASILAARPDKSILLIFDNLQQEGNLRADRSPFRQINQRQTFHHQALAHWNNLALWQGSGAGYFRSAGPMHNLLGSLAGRCPNLKSLKICKVGERLLGKSCLDYSSKDGDPLQGICYLHQFRQIHTARILL